MDIEHIALNVSDPPAMAEWYVKHLGMQVLRKLTEAPFTHFIADRGGRVVLELYHQTKAPVPDYRSFDPMVLHIAFKVANVRQEHDRLLKAGATVATDLAVSPNGDEMSFLRDPWGVTVQLVKRAQPL
jgi:catechol 2,3-dioxygenase-like lactoylglutathione lyase family enzyme